MLVYCYPHLPAPSQVIPLRAMPCGKLDARILNTWFGNWFAQVLVPLCSALAIPLFRPGATLDGDGLRAEQQVLIRSTSTRVMPKRAQQFDALQNFGSLPFFYQIHHPGDEAAPMIRAC
jgi:hypothetical protein